MIVGILTGGIPLAIFVSIYAKQPKTTIVSTRGRRNASFLISVAIIEILRPFKPSFYLKVEIEMKQNRTMLTLSCHTLTHPSPSIMSFYYQRTEEGPRVIVNSLRWCKCKSLYRLVVANAQSLNVHLQTRNNPCQFWPNYSQSPSQHDASLLELR